MTNEILTPTEKLKATRKKVAELDGAIGKVVTYDDDTTAELLNEAERIAVDILQIIHDNDQDDIEFAVSYHKRLPNQKTVETPETFQVGDKIKHALYGKGEVIDIDGEAPENHILVHYFKRSLDCPDGFNKITAPCEIERI